MDQNASGWKHIYTSSTGTVYAEYDYWKPVGGSGGGPPVIGGSGTVYYTPWLTSDPGTPYTASPAKIPGPMTMTTQEVNTDPTESASDSLTEAMKQVMRGNYNRAARIYQDIIDNNRDTNEKMRATLEYGHLVARSKDNRMVSYLEAMYPKAGELQPETGMALVKAYLSTDDTTKAVKLMNHLISNYPSSDAAHYLHTVAFTISYGRGELTDAKNHYEVLNKQNLSTEKNDRVLLWMKYLLNNASEDNPYASASSEYDNQTMPADSSGIASVQSMNYPNPFNPTTTIRYRLVQGGHVRLAIYDVLGRQVATLVDANQQKGVHRVTFIASQLASGVYFYRLQVGNKVMVKKMLLMK